MERDTAQRLIIATVFAGLAVGLVMLALHDEERYREYREAHPELTAKEAGPSLTDRLAASWFSGDDWSSTVLLSYSVLAAIVFSYLWILVMAFGVGAGWGFAVFLGNWLGALLFLLFHPDKAAKPLLLLVGAFVARWLLR